MNRTEFAGLIAPEALEAQLGSSNLVVIDIRSPVDGGGKAAYEAGHVPGAVHSDYAADGWRAKVGNAPGMLPPLDHLAVLAGRLGIKPHDNVVIVPAGVSATDFAAAARIYWTLKLIGHGQQAILDGGFKAWSADPKRPVETGPSAPKSVGPYPVVMQQRLRGQLFRGPRKIGGGGTSRAYPRRRLARLHGCVRPGERRAQTRRRPPEAVRQRAAGTCDLLLQHRPHGCAELVRHVRGSRPRRGCAL
jgi:rhodanese-related sulfurtransferase